MTDEYRLTQNKTPVAWTSGPKALQEIGHYAAVFSEDGPVKIQFKTKAGRWANLRTTKEMALL